MDLKKMMQQAQQMQTQLAEKMEAAQKKLETQEVEGSSGGGLVQCWMSGKGVVKRISLDDSLFTEFDKEMREDLVVAAIADAKTKADALEKSEMSQVTGGLPLSGGFPAI